MFKINHERKIWYPITINMVTDGGKIEPHDIEVQYQLLTRKEILEKTKESKRLASSLLTGLSDVHDLRDDKHEQWVYSHVCDWKDVCDEEGDPMAFSGQTLKALCDEFSEFFLAIETGLLQASAGAPAKN